MESTVEHLEGSSGLRLGCKLIIQTEIERLDEKIHQSLSEFELTRTTDFRHFFSSKESEDWCYLNDSEDDSSETSSQSSSDDKSSFSEISELQVSEDSELSSCSEDEY